MAITGITSTTERGVRIVTTAQNLAAASATSESIVIDGSGAIRASGTADILLKRCNIHVNATAGSTSQTNQVWLSYNGDDTGRTLTTRKLRLQETSVMVKSSARVDFFFSELTNCLISEVDSTRNLNVYTQPGAILNNTRFTGIKTWEVVGTPAQAGGLVFDGVGSAFFNYEAGRLDFTRINVISFTSSACFFSQGNGGNNSAYNWDVVSFDRTKIGRELANNLYYEGVSASLEFRDRDTAAAQSDVLVVYRDDRATTGTFTERGRYVTNSSGRMAGTYDSRFDVAGVNQERPALFMLRWKLVDNATTGAYTSLTFGGAAGRRYDLVAIQPRVEVRSYLHQAPSGYGPADNYTITAAQGVTNGDFSVNTYANFNMVADAGVTVSKATALAYSQLDTLDQLYDRSKAAWRDNDGFPLPAFVGSVFSFGTRNILIDGTAASAYAFNSGTNTITIKASALAAGAKFTSLKTTGSITFANGGSITTPYTDSSGTRVTIKTSDNLPLTTRLLIDGADQGEQVEQAARNIYVTSASVVRIYAHAYGYQPKIINVTGNAPSDYVISLAAETNVDTSLDTTTRNTIMSAFATGIDAQTRIYLSVNTDLRQYTPAQVLNALHRFMVVSGGTVSAAALAQNDVSGFALIRGGFILRTPGFYGKVAESVTADTDMGLYVPLYIMIDPAVYVLDPTFTPVKKNAAGVVLGVALWTQQEADVPTWVANQASLQVLNRGVQKASLLIPHSETI